MGLMEPLDVVIHLDFAFDIGYEIDLERARPLLHGRVGRAAAAAADARVDPLSPRPVAGAGRRLGRDAAGEVGDDRGRRAGELSLFDFGAISLAVQFPVRLTPRGAARAGRRAGRARAPERRGAAASSPPGSSGSGRRSIGFELSDLSEEYIVFQVDDARADWLESHADWIAGLVRLEAGPAQPRRGRRGDPAEPLVHARTTSSRSTGPPGSSPTATAPTRSR